MELRLPRPVAELSILDDLPYAVLICDPAGTVVATNTSADGLLGPVLSSPGWPLRALVRPEDAGSVHDAVTVALGSPGRHFDVPVTVVPGLEGEEYALRITVSALEGGEGVLVLLGRPSEDLRRADALKASEERFRALLDTAPVGIVGSGAGPRATWVNRRCVELFGLEADCLLGAGWYAAFAYSDRDRLSTAVARAVADGEESRLTLELTRPDGTRRVVDLRIAPVTAGRDCGFVASIDDVTETRELHAALDHRARHDPLTGLPNRHELHDRLGRLLSVRSADHGPAVLFVDLDHFKDVNDTLGHNVGDELLRHIASRLTACVRDVDTVCRFGGDEFVLLLPGVTDDQIAATVGARVVQAVAGPTEIAGHEINVTTSVGVVVAGPHATVESLLRDADIAMYRAKSAGRNRWAVFAEDDRSQLAARVELQAALHRAIERRLIDVHFQPIVALADRSIMGFEALARWHDPELGAIAPDRFIPVAEETGLIEDLGRIVRRRALDRLASWRRLPGNSELFVTVNASAVELSRPGVVESVAVELAEAGLPGEALVVELTESTAMEGEAEEVLEGLRRLGVRLAIDDFGSGYSNLARLRRLCVDKLKVDRSLVAGLGDTEDDAVIGAVGALASIMGVPVVAEGVETDGQAALLLGAGIEFGQGYLFSRPVPDHEVPGLLAHRDSTEEDSGAVEAVTGE